MPKTSTARRSTRSASPRSTAASASATPSASTATDRSNVIDTFVGPATRLADADFTRAAARLGCEEAAIRAVAEVESGGRAGFLDDRRPLILFESRWFHKLTAGRHDATHPDISTPTWVHNYKGGKGEYPRLQSAIALNRDAALKAASWGMFQILGVNHRVVGFAAVEDFVAAMVAGEGQHLEAFVEFVLTQSLADELRDKRWDDFARVYNGPAYAQNRYAEKMAAAYAKYAGGIVTPDTAQVQAALNRHGFMLDVDGITGPRTRAALREFQHRMGLPVTGVADAATLAALGLTPMRDPLAPV